ncbi:MAG: metallophosphoesterase family protein [Clostridiales bacterium]|jgi:putative phosphoesterase|nr:metallophosphoesterase family protein [Clostridiales bacterium]
MVIGVISDTHGMLSNRAIDALKGSNAVLHAGDVGSPGVLEALEKIAPVYPVKGNTDRGIWTERLPMTQLVELGGRLFYVIHNLGDLDIVPESIGVDAVIYGHTHIPKEERKKGVLYFNPGSAGPKRFRLPVCLGKITITNGDLTAEWIDLE